MNGTNHPSNGFSLTTAATAGLCFLAALVYALLCLLPWQPGFPVAALDSSWEAVISAACVRHWDFGHDIAFTYGPWGFLTAPQYHPALYATALVGKAILAAILVVCLWRTAWGVTDHPRRRIFWAVGLCFLVTELIAHDPFQLDYLLLWQLPLQQFFVRVPTSPACGEAKTAWTTALSLLLDIASVLAAAVLSLAKFSFFTLAVVLIAGVSADDILYRRRFPWKGCLFAVGLVAFWGLARQPLGSLLPYVRNSLEVAVGYIEMKTTGRWIHIPWYALTAAGTLYVIGRALWPQRRWWSLIPLFTVAAACEVIAKAAFVRHDEGHWPMAFFFLASVWLTAGPFLAAAVGASADRHLLRVTATLALLAAPVFYPQPLRAIQSFIPERVQSARSAVQMLRGTANYQAEYQRALAAVREKFPLPPLHGTVDLYPTDATILLAHDAQYHPRPMFQSISAYTPKLAQMNADFLRGPQAPENILFDIQPLDWWSLYRDRGRFPSLDDGLSWPELLTRYDLCTPTADAARVPYLWLKRAPQPRTYTITPVEQRTIAWDEAVTLPAIDDGPLWAEIDVSHSLLGRAAALVLKDPIVRIEVVTHDGNRIVYRLTTATARVGFLLSPLIDNRDAFARLAATRWGERSWREAAEKLRIDTLCLTAKHGHWAFQPKIALRLFRLKFAAGGQTVKLEH